LSRHTPNLYPPASSPDPQRRSWISTKLAEQQHRLALPGPNGAVRFQPTVPVPQRGHHFPLKECHPVAPGRLHPATHQRFTKIQHSSRGTWFQPLGTWVTTLRNKVSTLGNMVHDPPEHGERYPGTWFSCPRTWCSSRNTFSTSRNMVAARQEHGVSPREQGVSLPKHGFSPAEHGERRLMSRLQRLGTWCTTARNLVAAIHDSDAEARDSVKMTHDTCHKFAESVTPSRDLPETPADLVGTIQNSAVRTRIQSLQE
jgi:hypothetical protein